MSFLIIKLILCPLSVYISDFLFDDFTLQNLNQIILLGLILAVSTRFLEYILLREDTLWINTFADFAVGFILVYLSRFFFSGAKITIFGAALTALILSISEYFQHSHLIKNREYYRGV